jgi:hypothetical protein
MLMQAAFSAMMVPTPALIARVLAVSSGGGGGGGGGGQGGSGGKGGRVTEILALPIQPGTYLATVGQVVSGKAGAPGGGDFTSAAGQLTSLGSLISAAAPTSNTTPNLGGEGAGAAASGLTGGAGVTSDITGTSVTYGRGGDAATPGSDGATGSNPGDGGGGGSGNDPGGSGANSRAGLLAVWYPGSQRATGGTVSTINSGTLHLLANGQSLVVPF